MRLAHKKSHLDISMVTADIKHITQFEELVLLKEFEKRETTFTSRYQTKRDERTAMTQKVLDLHETKPGTDSGVVRWVRSNPPS